MNREKVTIGIKTFNRANKLKKCLKSLKNGGFKEIIAVDNGEITQEKQKIYDEAKESLPIRIIKLKFNSGLGIVHNKMTQELKSPYLFIIDDDMELINIDPLIEILEENSNVGGVTGGLLENKKIILNAGNLYQEGKTLFQENNETLLGNLNVTKNRVPFFIYDYIRYPLLLKKECIEDYGWDLNYEMGWEHLDFFWGHKKLNKWNFAITPSSITIHNPGGSPSYLSHRFKKSKLFKGRNYFLKKFNIDKFIVKNISLTEKLESDYYIIKHIKRHLPLTILKIYNIMKDFLIKFYIKYYQKILKPDYYVGPSEKIYLKFSKI